MLRDNLQGNQAMAYLGVLKQIADIMREDGLETEADFLTFATMRLAAPPVEPAPQSSWYC